MEWRIYNEKQEPHLRQIKGNTVRSSFSRHCLPAMEHSATDSHVGAITDCSISSIVPSFLPPLLSIKCTRHTVIFHRTLIVLFIHLLTYFHFKQPKMSIFLHLYKINKIKQQAPHEPNACNYEQQAKPTTTSTDLQLIVSLRS